VLHDEKRDVSVHGEQPIGSRWISAATPSCGVPRVSCEMGTQLQSADQEELRGRTERKRPESDDCGSRVASGRPTWPRIAHRYGRDGPIRLCAPSSASRLQLLERGTAPAL